MVEDLLHGIADSILFGQPEWRVMCLCPTEARAEEIARAISYGGSHPVRISRLDYSTTRKRGFVPFKVPFKWFPDEATCRETEQRYRDEIAQKEAQMNTTTLAESEEQA